MDGIQQVALPILGIVAAAAATFYAVSFSELREVAFSSSVLTKLIIVWDTSLISFGLAEII